MMPGQPSLTSLGQAKFHQVQTDVIQDWRACIPLARVLSDGGPLLLLSPCVAPPEPVLKNNKDPFEPLGRALAAGHQGGVRHVPYLPQFGITQFHVDMIQEATAVIFVISGVPDAGQPSQVEMAETARIAGEGRPQIIVACHDIGDLNIDLVDFPTIVQLPGCSTGDLEEAAAVLFGEIPLKPKKWPVETLHNLEGTFDITPIRKLWNQCLPSQFHLENFALRRLLEREGISKHYMVKAAVTGEIMGFCATYTAYAYSPNSTPKDLIASLAIIIVHPCFRRRGVGWSLHGQAVEDLPRVRGVDRIQLGTTFPRLLAGLPVGGDSDTVAEEWFQRRGWQITLQRPGCGQEICDWLLNVSDWPNGGFPTLAGFDFRRCNNHETDLLFDFVNEATRDDHIGFFDRYRDQWDRLGDVILGLHGRTIVATAITYVPSTNAPMAEHIPWPWTIGPDVGGVTCICMPARNSGPIKNKDAVMFRLLGACVNVLRDQGMQRVFLDGFRGGQQGFQQLGFEKWATYRDVWRQV